jgi:hypothetical protein
MSASFNPGARFRRMNRKLRQLSIALLQLGQE